MWGLTSPPGDNEVEDPMGRDAVDLMQTKMGDVLSDDEAYLGAQSLTIKSSRALATRPFRTHSWPQ
jgi:hypothetical protein